MFVHLRNHTTYSLCKGAIKIPDFVARAREYKMPALAITDSTNLFGALDFSMQCCKNGIQPIIGCDLLIDANLHGAGGADSMVSALDRENSLCKLPLIATNEEGYLNLMALVSESYLTRESGISPHSNFEKLKKHSKSLIALSGSVEGIIGKLLLNNQDQRAQSFIKQLMGLFPDSFYIELTRHGAKEEERLEDKFIDMAYQHNLPLVATNDVYFMDQNIYEAQDILSCIADGHYVNQTDRKRLTPHHYFKSSQEMCELFSDIPEAVQNTVNIAKRCHVMAKTRPPTLPHFQTEGGISEAEQLRKNAHKGLQERLKIKFINEEISDLKEQQEVRKIYEERIDYELEIIIKMDFPGYFLIVADFIVWSKTNGIPVGPGRGSGAGSVIAWSLQITNLDPIRFGLLFERFLNPARISMPDFDVDFCQSRRGEVIEYVQRKYGEDMVAMIITFGKLQARAVLKDVGRVLQMPYGQVDRISKLIPFNAIDPVTLAQAIEMDKELQQARDEDRQTAKLISIALKLEGLNRHSSTHAAGVVIGDKPLQQICALYTDSKEDIPAVGYSMKYAEAAGLVKFDFLGLKTLTTIAETVKIVEKNRNIKIDIDNIRLDDKLTFEMLAQGDSIGAFQIESSGMRSTLRQMRIDSFEEIIALISLYRPGPMDHIPTYIARKHGKEKIIYPHPMLEEILKETYGVIVYQEQVMEIAKTMGGYSLGEADLLRRAMGKKIKEEMDLQREKFVEGSVKNGIDKHKAGEIFDLVAKFAGYGFNKSHAAAYALISYQTAWLKAHYPVEFLTASINLDIHDTDKINIFCQHAINKTIKVLPPDVNKSQAIFSVESITPQESKAQDASGESEKSNESAGSAGSAGSNESNESAESAGLNKGEADKSNESDSPADKPVDKLTQDTGNSNSVSSSGGNQPQVRKYDENGHELAIRFGLGAIKAVGIAIMEDLIKERNKNDDFTDIFTFAERLGSKIVNKKSVEALAKSGAFDTIHANRKQIVESCETLTSYASKREEEKNSNQMNLFGGGAVEISAPALSTAQNWQGQEKLRNEFEAFGFFLNEHPIDEYEEELGKRGVINYIELDDFKIKDRAIIRLAGVVADTKHRSSARGRFAYLYLSDPTGLYETAIFNEDLITSSRDLMESGTALVLQCNLRKDEGGTRILVSSLEKLGDFIENTKPHSKIYRDIKYPKANKYGNGWKKGANSVSSGAGNGNYGKNGYSSRAANTGDNGKKKTQTDPLIKARRAEKIVMPSLRQVTIHINRKRPLEEINRIISKTVIQAQAQSQEKTRKQSTEIYIKIAEKGAASQTSTISLGDNYILTQRHIKELREIFGVTDIQFTQNEGADGAKIIEPHHKTA